MPLTRWQPPTIRGLVDDEGHVTWIELYFDLIYVAALIQLGDALADDVTWGGFLRFAAVFAILWWTWIGTTAFMNRFAVDDVTHRVLVFVQMFAVGNLAIHSVGDFAATSITFALSYVAARVPLLVMYWRVHRTTPSARPITGPFMTAFALSIGTWLASTLVAPPARYGLWAVAIVLEYSVPWFVQEKGAATPIHVEHFSERFALFTIIVLGESFVKGLSELAGVGATLESQIFGALAFVVGAALWWTYFDDVADSDLRPTLSPTQRIIWSYSHLPLAIGLTSLGVATKKLVAVESFTEPVTFAYLALLVGGVSIVLVAVAVLDWATVSPHFGISTRQRVLPRLVAAGLLAIVVLTLADAPALVSVGAVAIVAVGQIGAEVVAALKAERRMTSEMSDTLGTHRLCTHLEVAVGRTGTTVCGPCRDEGKPWVQLRVCLECGYVGCCDSSQGRHATAHHHESGHPVVATLEPGETWAYCYVDEVTDPAFGA